MTENAPVNAANHKKYFFALEPDTLDKNQKNSIWFPILILIAIIIIAGALWLFVELTDEVLEGETHTFDTRILLAMRDADDISDPCGPKWLEEMGRDFTALGGIPVLGLVTTACVGGMFITGYRRTSYLILFAVIGGAILTFSLKSGIDRPRPDLVPYGSHIYTRSFPSGHAMLSTITYLSLGFLLTGRYKQIIMQIYIVMVSILIACLVGLSRVYLAVHWPTDVIAGWALGSAWTLFCWIIGYKLGLIGKYKNPN